MKTTQKLSRNNLNQIEIKKRGVTITLTPLLKYRKRSIISIDVELMEFLKFTQICVKKNIIPSIKRIFSRAINITVSDKIHFEKDYLLQVVKMKGQYFSIVSNDLGESLTFKGDLSSSIALTMFSHKFLIDSVFTHEEKEVFLKNVRI